MEQINNNNARTLCGHALFPLEAVAFILCASACFSNNLLVELTPTKLQSNYFIAPLSDHNTHTTLNGSVRRQKKGAAIFCVRVSQKAPLGKDIREL